MNNISSANSYTSTRVFEGTRPLSKRQAERLKQHLQQEPHLNLGVTSLRTYYLKTQRYVQQNPNDLVAKESLRVFLQALGLTNQNIVRTVTNPNLTDEEIRQLEVLPRRRKKVKYDDSEENIRDS